MLERLLDTTSLTGREWLVVIGLSLIAPAVVAVDKVIQISRQNATGLGAGRPATTGRAAPVRT